MKKKVIGITAIAAIVVLFSCKDEVSLSSDVLPPEPTVEKHPSYKENTMKDREILPIYYSENGGRSFIADYQAVRIGEYLWMNSNFTAPVEAGHEVTQAQINRGLYRAGHIDTMNYRLTPNDVNKYIGQYYCINQIEQMNLEGNMFEGAMKQYRGKWGLPSVEDFKQLFAMCGEASEPAVRATLSYRVDEIPIIQKRKNIFWVQESNTNKYGFNLIYAGQRAHNDGCNWGTCYSANDCATYYGDRGNFIILYTAAVYPTSDNHTVIIHDYPDTSRGKEWLWKPVRWCRRLTDSELGYRLYINNERTDIKKMEPNSIAPRGYHALEKGYLRGFYVQFILGKENPEKTVAEIIKMADEIG